MNRHSPLFRKLDRMACVHSGLNCTALRISRSLDEACRALPPGKCHRTDRLGCDHCTLKNHHERDHRHRNR